MNRGSLRVSRLAPWRQPLTFLHHLDRPARRADDHGRPKLLCLLLASALLPSCVEEKVVYNRPLLAGLPGVQTSQEVTGPRFKAYDPRAAVPDDQITVKNPDGTTTLVAKTGRQLMIHIYNTLREDQPDLFVDQVLADRTREEYYKRGLNPSQAFDELKRRLPDVKKLFDQMPMGEYTPGLFVRNMGAGVTRLETNGAGARGLRWTAMDMVYENENWRLVWFVEAGS